MIVSSDTYKFMQDIATHRRPNILRIYPGGNLAAGINLFTQVMHLVQHHPDILLMAYVGTNGQDVFHEVKAK